ncbi:hypothetical protein CC80DRAFT_522292 [Byssothecium circinans]|uniref:Zona occludens toxin N-terminal domain-containing protein n=1 Tax=Byssothecium circinans TaxID=147558 RepID=A0A6A5UHY1_9PLEO|nr:hypothetical protein CC80DRAFT_522292 [Byssothecium circinans]
MRPDLAKKKIVNSVVYGIERQLKSARPEDQPMSDKQASASKPTPNQPLVARTRPQTKALSSSSGTGSAARSGLSSTPSPLKQDSKPTVSTAAEPLSQAQVEEFVRKEYMQRYHDASGKLKQAPDLSSFARILHGLRPGYLDAIYRTLRTIDDELLRRPLTQQESSGLLTQAQLECDKLTWTDSTRDLNRAVVVTAVAQHRPDIHREKIEAIVRKAEEFQQSAKRQAAAMAPAPAKKVVSAPAPVSAKATPAMTAPRNAEEEFEAWVYQQYMDFGFSKGGFRGFKWLIAHLQNQKPKVEPERIRQTVRKLQNAGPKTKYSFGKVDEVYRAKKKQLSQTAKTTTTANSKEQPAQTAKTTTNANSQTQRSEAHPRPSTAAELAFNVAGTQTSHMPPPALDEGPKNDLLARKMNQLHLSDKLKIGSTNLSPRAIEGFDSDGQEHDSGVDVPSPLYDSSVGVGKATQLAGVPVEAEYDMTALLSDSSDEENDQEDENQEFDAEIQHAPLFDEDFTSDDYKHLVPQYGLMGLHSVFADSKSALFINTNTPFSAFICGVQGSGKSHTTACIMENALIPSKNLGKLQNPLSALVFSYGHFSGDGSGYSVSEAAFLAAPHPKMPGGAHVKKVNVLVSPSNFVRISKLYLRIPNVTVSPFKLKPWNLDIDVMLTLMNVSESGEPPLYMAQVTQILRKMATSGGPFNYMAFKTTLRQQKFNPAQVNMLQMRLNLLESFLDLDNSCPEPKFTPGEITIMDMSCPFVDPNTACILFRIGLQRYLQSDSPGKMIVLDEAHKYMLNVPGAKALNETLLTTIRLQRHYGARVIISTQEPTLLTNLIALCSITFIHRFSSPEWLAAIKRHIPMAPPAAQALMTKIEGLKTGTALVYSSNAVLGWNEDDRLIKGSGKMMRVRVRKRITSDGGQSVLAV